MASRIGFVAFAGVMIAAGAAGAAGSSTTAEARLAWATRHVELVCQPLEAKQMFEKATRCYNDVARIVADAAKAKSETVASAAPVEAKVAKPVLAKAKPASQPAGLRPATRSAAARKVPATRVTAAPRQPAPAIVAETRVAVVDASPALPNGRCQGISCLKRYTLLGVGF